MIMEIVASIIAKSQEELEERIAKVGFMGTIQLDIMDGKFVSNHSLDFELSLPKGHKYEAHLMVDAPGAWVKENWKKVDLIIMPIESLKGDDLVGFLKDKGKKVGLAINPETTIRKLKPYLNRVDRVLVMTVNPGAYGAGFIPETLEKVRKLRRDNPKLDIEVDGGMKKETIMLAREAGANFFACGSYLQDSENPKDVVDRIKASSSASPCSLRKRT